MRRPKLGLGARLALAMVGSLAVLLSSLGWIYFRHYRQSQEQLIMQSEDRLGELIRRSTRQAMLRNDREELAAMLPEIGRMPGLERVRVYDKTGAIRYSSLAGEVGQRVDLTADACDRCHATAQPLTRLDRPDRTRIYPLSGHRVMGMIHPVPNEPDCSSADCHVHSPDRAILGVLDVQMSLQAVDEVVRQRVRSFVATSLAALMLMSAFSVFIVWRTVQGPVRNLIGATRAISAGRLDERVPDLPDSDLSELVRSFNQMTADLQAARREAETWAQSLERRVGESTQALRRAQDEMVQVEKMVSLGKLAAIVAHEINNPLAGIRTYAKLLLKKLASAAEKAPGSAPPYQDPQEAKEWLGRIESEAARCGDIVRNLLSFSRSSRPEIRPTDLNEVIEQSLRLVQHQFDLASIQVSRGLDQDLPPVECDPQQIKQALLAILLNACEAMPQGGTLTARSLSAGLSPGPIASDGGASSGEAQPGGEAVIILSDTGVGMDAETRKHVFEPFFTTKDGTTTGGTGIGLAVVYSIVRSHGGTVGVESSPGRGSAFTITLPCRHVRHVEEGETA